MARCVPEFVPQWLCSTRPLTSLSTVQSLPSRRRDQQGTERDRTTQEGQIAADCSLETPTEYTCVQAKQNADELLQKKLELEKEKKETEAEATEKEKLRDKKCKTIGNYVHESVPINDNEVGSIYLEGATLLTGRRISTRWSNNGLPKALLSTRKTACRTTKSWPEQRSMMLTGA